MGIDGARDRHAIERDGLGDGGAVGETEEQGPLVAGGADDHLVGRQQVLDLLRRALPFAEDGPLVTLGRKARQRDGDGEGVGAERGAKAGVVGGDGEGEDAALALENGEAVDGDLEVDLEGAAEHGGGVEPVDPAALVVGELDGLGSDVVDDGGHEDVAPEIVVPGGGRFVGAVGDGLHDADVAVVGGGAGVEEIGLELVVDVDEIAVDVHRLVVEHPRAVVVVSPVLHQRAHRSHLGPAQEQLLGAALGRQRRAMLAVTAAITTNVTSKSDC